MDGTMQKRRWADLPVMWKSLSLQRRISIVVILAAFLAALILFISYYTTPRMGLLFRGLPPDRAAGVMARLDALGVPYELGAGGQEIHVPEDRVDELRINLSSDGSLYGSSVGFELFDETGIGVSESERRLNYQRALQGELERTIAQIEGITQARVHLVTPEPSVFVRETAQATASVVLRLDPLSALREDQVMGIVYLVAGSVENLPPENVTVIDTQGRILSGRGEAGLGAADSLTSAAMSRLEIKRAFERELEVRVQGLLERVLGSGTVAAMVTADLDFDSQERTEIIYGEPVLRSRSRTDEQFQGSGAAVGGLAGTDSNIPSYPALEGGGESTFARLDEIENFEISETKTQTIHAPGEVRNISASVIYDNSRGTLSPGQIEDLEGLVAAALGLSPQRGDQISIAAIDFDTTFMEETAAAMESAARAQRISQYVRYGLTAVAVIAGLLLFMLILRSLKAMAETSMAHRQQPAPALAQPVAEPNIAAVGVEDEHQGRIRKISQQSPDTAIALLKIWLSEDQR